jgi:hypothetical protein
MKRHAQMRRRMLQRHQVDQVLTHRGFNTVQANGYVERHAPNITGLALYAPSLGAEEQIQRKAGSGSPLLLDAILFFDRLEHHLVTAIKHAYPRPAPAHGLEHMPAIDGRLPADML